MLLIPNPEPKKDTKIPPKTGECGGCRDDKIGTLKENAFDNEPTSEPVEIRTVNWKPNPDPALTIILESDIQSDNSVDVWPVEIPGENVLRWKLRPASTYKIAPVDGALKNETDESKQLFENK
jgi:hypothetical protein